MASAPIEVVVEAHAEAVSSSLHVEKLFATMAADRPEM